MYIIFPLQYVLTTVIVFVLHILSITKAVTTFDEKSNQAALKYLYRIMFLNGYLKCYHQLSSLKRNTVRTIISFFNVKPRLMQYFLLQRYNLLVLCSFIQNLHYRHILVLRNWTYACTVSQNCNLCIQSKKSMTRPIFFSKQPWILNKDFFDMSSKDTYRHFKLCYFFFKLLNLLN